MPAIEVRLALLARCPRREQAAVAIEALASAERGEAAAIAGALAASGRPEALAAVIGDLSRLGEAGLECLRAERHRLKPALEILLAGGERAGIASAIAAVRRLHDPALLPPLLELFAGRDRSLAEAAGETLLEMTLDHLGPHGTWPCNAPAGNPLDASLAGAARRFRAHRPQSVLLAIALASNRPGPLLRRLLADPDEPAVLALHTVAERLDLPIVRRNLLAWLQSQAMGRPVARRLHHVRGEEAFSDLLERGHLLLVRAHRRALLEVERAMHCVPDLPCALAMSQRAQAFLPRYLGGLALPARILAARLGELKRLPAIAGRVRALEELVGRDDTRPAALAPFCLDTCAPVAAVASRKLTSAAACDRQTLLCIEQQGGPPIAAAARSALARRSLDDFLDRWLRLPDAQRLAAARLAVARDPAALAARLAGLIAGPAPDVALAAIMLARRLGLTARVLPAVSLEVKSADERVASAAVAAIGSLVASGAAGEADGHTLRRALEHPSPRVRANAIDALQGDSSDRKVAGAVALAAARDENRPRASAVRALMVRDPAKGLGALHAMLRDERPGHRVSALWLARRCRSRAVLPQVAAMAEQDEVPGVRAAAGRILRLLSHPAQVHWSGEARREPAGPCRARS